MFSYVNLDVQSHQDFFPKSRISSKTPWKSLWRHIYEIVHFQCIQSLKLLLRVSLVFSFDIPDMQNHLVSIQESRMSSKTPWRTLLRHIKDCHLAVYSDTGNFRWSFFDS